MPNHCSFAIEDMKKGTGLFDNVNLTIMGVKFTKQPPSDSYTVEGNPIFTEITVLLDGDAPAEDRTATQSYSHGASAGDNFTIDEGGFSLSPVTADAAARLDSKWGTFCAYLQNGGVPKPLLAEGDFSKLIGLRGLFKRVADEVRVFAEEKRTRPGATTRKNSFPQSTLVMVKLLRLPGETVDRAGTGTTAAPATGAAAPAAAAVAPVQAVNGSAGPAVVVPAQAAAAAPAAAPVAFVDTGDLDLNAMTALQATIRNANGAKLPVSKLAMAVFRTLTGHPAQADIATRANNKDFLEGLIENGIIVRGGTTKDDAFITLAP